MTENNLIEEDEQFEVRDLRPKGWFWTDDEFLNGYARLLGTTFSMIYLDLCRHADKNQRAHPSQSTIAKELSLNISSVNEGIKVLEYFGLIKKIRVGKTCTNRYILLGKKHWRRDFSELLSITERLEKLDKNNKNDVEQFKNTLSSDLAQFKITTLTVLNHYVNSSKSNSKETHSKETHSKDTLITNSELDTSSSKQNISFSKNPPPSKQEPWTKELLQWLEEKQGAKFANYGKQLRALGNLKKAGYTPEQIKNCYEKMMKDKFWKERLPDFMNIANNITKYIKKSKVVDKDEFIKEQLRKKI
ncbi:MAG TPA: helix-turn-helix domain-containing protein [Candidatus Paceibacterota bacterium]|nr:helix-turn-helix domain-containing protein [Candidatus Paceibacterota bacterium]